MRNYETVAIQGEMSLGQHFTRVCLGLLGVGAFVIIGMTLEKIGLQFDTFYRVGCASMCLFFIWKLHSDYPKDQWPLTSLWIAFVANVGIFFTPLVAGHASRGEIMFFALPDAAILLGVRLSNFSVNDDQQRSQRQLFIFGLVVAVVFCTILYSLKLTLGAH